MFFTAEDERARIKGSVDPLGLLSVWSKFGRAIVSNLTTQSTSVRGFATLLIGRYLAHELFERGSIEEEQALGVFLRFEQISAYVRHNAHQAEGEIRGIDRVKRYSVELKKSIPIGNPKQGEILSDQKTYGLWGLYSVPARESGLLPAGPLGLTPRAQELVEREYLPHLKPAWAKLLELVRKPGGRLELTGSNPVYKAVAAALSKQLREPERAFYADALRDGQLGEGRPEVRERQRQCARLLVECELLREPVDRVMVASLAEAAGSHGWESLAARLDRISMLEALIAPADRLFGYLCESHGKPVDAIAAELDDRWGRRALPYLQPDHWTAIAGEFQDAMGEGITAQAVAVLRAFLEGHWAAAVRALLEWNAQVMHSRRGFPWIGLVEGRLDVRYRPDTLPLPTRDELGDVWRNSYFLDSLRMITQQLEAA